VVLFATLVLLVTNPLLYWFYRRRARPVVLQPARALCGFGRASGCC
jgi:hypothetical protein